VCVCRAGTSFSNRDTIYPSNDARAVVSLRGGCGLQEPGKDTADPLRLDDKGESGAAMAGSRCGWKENRRSTSVPRHAPRQAGAGGMTRLGWWGGAGIFRCSAVYPTLAGKAPSRMGHPGVRGRTVEKQWTGFAPHFSSHVRWSERGAPDVLRGGDGWLEALIRRRTVDRRHLRFQ
jgi:hypothetical protein